MKLGTRFIGVLISGFLTLSPVCHTEAVEYDVKMLSPGPSSYMLPADFSQLKKVRVSLLKGVTVANISFTSAVTVRTIETGKVLGTYFLEGSHSVRPTKVGCVIGRTPFKIYGVRISPLDQTFSVNGRMYRGDVVVIRDRDMTLQCINYIDLEDYVKGVLPKEVSPTWPSAALKVQAVVSRTFAVFLELGRQHKDYSLEKTVLSQVYGGKTSEHEVTNAIVEQTAGEILTYDQRVFPAYFHAACGGRTTRAETVWQTQPHPALQGVACPFCKESKYYEWKKHISIAELSDKVHKKNVQNIHIAGYDQSARAIAIDITGDDGYAQMQGNAFRLEIGPELIRSTKITCIVKENTDFVFEGHGWGHGVGLCQWGAKKMADDGCNYEEILRYYFPQTKKVAIRT